MTCPIFQNAGLRLMHFKKSGELPLGMTVAVRRRIIVTKEALISPFKEGFRDPVSLICHEGRLDQANG